MITRLLKLSFCLTVISCTGQNQFDQFIGQIKPIPTRLILRSKTYSNERVQEVDKKLLDRFRPKIGGAVYGKINYDNGVVGIIYMVVGDINKPILMTYDRNGVRLDSINIFEKSVWTRFGTITQIAQLEKNKWSVVDSVKTWKMDKGSEVTDEIESITVSKSDYFVDDKGKIRKRD